MKKNIRTPHYIIDKGGPHMTRQKTATLLLAASLFLTACAAPTAGSQVQNETRAAEAAKDTGKVTAAIDAESPDQAGDVITAEAFAAFKQEKEQEIVVLHEEIENLKAGQDQTPDNSAIAFRQRPAGMLYFPLFMEGAEDQVLTARGYVAIRPQDPVPVKLEQLTAGISELLFGGLAIEFTGIKEEDGRQVAWIDLKGSADWTELLQGSTGGGITSQALVESYLQRDYKNSWVAGVHFTMDGEDIKLEHAPLLGETRFR